MRQLTGAAALLFMAALASSCADKSADSAAVVGTDADTDTDTDTDTAPTDPCVVAIPPTAVVIDADSDIRYDDNLDFWVCSTSTLSLLGASNRVFVEANGELILGGADNLAYAKDNAEVAVIAKGNTVHHEAGAVVLDDSGALVTHTCKVLTFDYTSAPKGC